MLLAIDIGNTNITVGLFREKGHGKILIVSVSPKRLKQVLKLIRKRKLPKPYIIGKDIMVPLKSKYNKKQIGQDRLVTAYAAAKLYGRPVLIIDFGTAVTFDIVSKRNEYLGGLILPGIKMSLESLHNKTALLPYVELKKAKGLIGRSTEDSIRLGMIYGYASLCEGLIRRFKKKFPSLKVVATGGDAGLISQHTEFINNIDNNLSLKGLLFLSHLLALV